MENTNSFRGEVEIILDKPRTLKFTKDAIFKAEAALRSACGLTLMGITPAQLGLEGIAILLAHGLRFDDRKVTLERAQEWTIGNVGLVTEKVMLALAYGFGLGEQLEKDEALQPEDATKNA